MFSGLLQPASLGTSLGVHGLATMMSRLIGLGRGVALTWLVSRGEFGLFTVTLLLTNVLMPLCSLGLGESVLRYAPQADAAGATRGFARRSAILALLISTGATTGLVMGAGWFGGFLLTSGPFSGLPDAATMVRERPITMIRLAAVCVFSLVAFHYVLNLLKGLRLFRAVGAMEVLAAVLFSALAVGGAVIGYSSAGALLVTYASANALTVAAFLPAVLRYLRDGIPAASSSTAEAPCPQPAESARDKTHHSPTDRAVATPHSARILLGYGVGAMGATIVWQVMQYYPLWHLQKTNGSDAAGAFAAVRIITQLIQVCAAVMTTVLTAHVARLWADSGRRTATMRLDTLSSAAMVALLSLATMLAVAEPLAVRIFPAGFTTAGPAYRLLLLFFLLGGVVNLWWIQFLLLERPGTAAGVWLVGTAVAAAVAAALLGNPWHASDVVTRTSAQSLSGAAWAGVVGMSAALLTCAVLVHRRGLGLSPRSVLLAVACLGLAGPSWLALGIWALVAGLSFFRSVLFTPTERHDLRASLRSLLPSP